MRPLCFVAMATGDGARHDQIRTSASKMAEFWFFDGSIIFGEVDMALSSVLIQDSYFLEQFAQKI